MKTIIKLILLIACLLNMSELSAQIKLQGNLKYETDEWFSVWNNGVLFYQASDNEIFIRIINGQIEKNTKYKNSQPVLESIHASLSTKIGDDSWTNEFDSNQISLINQPLTETRKIDLSCLPEVQCYEFVIPIPEEIDLSKFWITLTITNPEKHTWYAHSNFFKSSFVHQKQN